MRRDKNGDYCLYPANCEMLGLPEDSKIDKVIELLHQEGYEEIRVHNEWLEIFREPFQVKMWFLGSGMELIFNASMYERLCTFSGVTILVNNRKNQIKAGQEWKVFCDSKETFWSVLGVMRDCSNEVEFVKRKKLDDEMKKAEKAFNVMDISETEKYTLAKSRIGHGAYKERLIAKYDGKCALCGLDYRELLIASHIKEWSVSDANERIDAENGLLLCALHDSVFDRHLITFSDDGEIMIAECLTEKHKALLNVSSKMRLKMSERTKMYMEYHRSVFCEGVK